MRSAGCAAHPENEIWIRIQVMMTAQSLKDEDQKGLVGAVSVDTGYCVFADSSSNPLAFC
jgi:hypothetical protein